MIVIADSGSSKTDWLFIEKSGKSHGVETPGINPFFQGSVEIFEFLKKSFSEINTKSVDEVFFYGAGSIKGKTDLIVKEALSQIFTNAILSVEDDIFGAARALLGKQKGIACILGTGSNSCLYNGCSIVDKVPALGFILGDEGSGAYLGKIFLNSYFKRLIPEDLKEKAERELSLEMPHVLSKVYKEEYPSRYLASFSKFINKYKTHYYIEELLKKGFRDFICNNVERYEGYKEMPVSFVGSIAFFYSDIVEQVAKEKGITVGTILHKPIDGLKHFHLNC